MGIRISSEAGLRKGRKPVGHIIYGGCAKSIKVFGAVVSVFFE